MRHLDQTGLRFQSAGVELVGINPKVRFQIGGLASAVIVHRSQCSRQFADGSQLILSHVVDETLIHYFVSAVSYRTQLHIVKELDDDVGDALRVVEEDVADARSELKCSLSPLVVPQHNQEGIELAHVCHLPLTVDLGQGQRLPDAHSSSCGPSEHAHPNTQQVKELRCAGHQHRNFRLVRRCYQQCCQGSLPGDCSARTP